MANFATLDFDGDFDRGYRVRLEVRSRNGTIEAKANLPPNSELATKLNHHWHENYRLMEIPYRLSPTKIVRRLPPEEQIEQCRQTASELQEQLQNWLDSEAFRAVDRRLREVLDPAEETRFLIRSNDTQLQKLPWHLWDCIDRVSAEAAFGPETIDSAPEKSRDRVGSKVRILAILGHSQDIDVDSDRRLLETLPNAEVEFLVEPTHEQLGDRIWDRPWDIIFFAGHGQTEDDCGRIYINPTESITVDRLWYGLKKAVERGLKIAIFNSCDGLGLVKQLDDTQIPHLVVMRELVPDRVAQSFLKYFLQSFSRGESFYKAVREARQHLEVLESEFPCASWLPVVFQHPGAVPTTWEKLQGDRNRVKWLKTSAIASGSCLLLYLAAGSFLASKANRWGMQYHKNGQFLAARSLYTLSTLLAPKKGIYHYNLGYLCDNMGDVDCAIAAHRQAAIEGSAEGYAEASRLLILKEDYHGATNSINQCLDRTEYDGVRAACLKNLGWIRFQQDFYPEAEAILRQAIALEDNSPHAYCLLARTLTAMGKMSEVSRLWQHFLQLENTNPDIPELGTCIIEAKQHLEVQP